MHLAGCVPNEPWILQSTIDYDRSRQRCTIDYDRSRQRCTIDYDRSRQRCTIDYDRSRQRCTIDYDRSTHFMARPVPVLNIIIFTHTHIGDSFNKTPTKHRPERPGEQVVVILRHLDLKCWPTVRHFPLKSTHVRLRSHVRCV
jgi:hypothetical protein